MKFRTTAFERILERYGQEITLHPQGEEVGLGLKAFLQPVLSQKDSWFQRQYTMLGLRQEELFLYLGPAGVPMDEMDQGWLEWNGRRFSVRASEAVFVGTEVSHWWALLVPREEDDLCP